MRSTSIAVLLVLAGAADAASAPERFLCVADKSAGFKWDGSEWQNVRFHPDGKYVVVRENGKVVVTALGKATPEYVCESTSLYVVCQNSSGRMTFNQATLRFAQYFTLGYTVGQDDDDLTPSITLGRCSRL